MVVRTYGADEKTSEGNALAVPSSFELYHLAAGTYRDVEVRHDEEFSARRLDS